MSSAGTGPLDSKCDEAQEHMDILSAWCEQFAEQGMGQGPCTPVRASQSFVYRELTERVIIVMVRSTRLMLEMWGGARREHNCTSASRKAEAEVTGILER